MAKQQQFYLILVAFVLFESFLFSYGNENDVIGCGGFIKSDTEINYKTIKIKLLTKDRVTKYTTEASPVNGYYMIPIYDKDEYILQVNPPPGWSFSNNNKKTKYKTFLFFFLILNFKF
jgi:hypothetical protein